jgi:beta-N-acetylhexosaminidase
MLIQPIGSVLASPPSQDSGPLSKAQELLKIMTPEKKIGQLFLIQFDGTETSSFSEIARLIKEYHIGGVILNRDNDNFSDNENLIQSIFELNRSLQTLEYESSLEVLTNFETQTEVTDQYVPLLIGISQDGDSVPNDQILSALSPQPSKMALGATWNTDLAFRAGEVLGFELQNLGFNLLLGPSLNILSSPRPESDGDINVNSFGGNPFWTAKMGAAYISGVHTGSSDTMLIIGKDFPGVSSPDRPLDDEIPIIRKTYEELINTDLVAFSDLTDMNEDPSTILDGLQIAHAKYEGLQGTIRTTTRPLSFDETNLQNLINQTIFLNWRTAGGLLVSDDLSSNAIQRFYAAQEEEFDVRLVALNAFLAGNEILNLGNYEFDNLTYGNSFPNITRTIDLFIQKYQEDDLFAQRVDEAVLRILTAKYKLYPNFEPSEVIGETIDHELIGISQDNSLSTALEAATLISPSLEDLDISMPEAPLQSDKIVIITDTDTAKQCSDCTEIDILSVDQFEQLALKLYGPDAGSRVVDRNIISYSLKDLAAFLSEEGPVSTQFESDITSADWIIFLLEEINGANPDSLAFQQLINERFDLIQQKKTVVFALNAPYYLDTTVISNVSVIYGLYSKQLQFIEVAVRLLFKEVAAPGASPVSIEGTGYDLSVALSPAPEQIVDLRVELADQATNPHEEVAVIEYESGDTILIQTNSILDHNGNIVPDNTPATFSLTTINNNEIISQREISALTANGIAAVNVTLDNAGALSIISLIADSLTTEPLKLDIIDVNNPAGTEVVYVPGNGVGQDGILNQSEMLIALSRGEVTIGLWFLLVMIAVFISIFAYQIAVNSGQIRWGIRYAFTTFIGGVLMITLLSSGAGMVTEILRSKTLWQVAIITAIGCLMGWLVGMIWKSLGTKMRES